MMNILIVDDEVEIAEEMGELLESPDRRICLANSGAEALVLAEGVGFDLVITDMRMPGMDGADLVRHLDAKSPGAILGLTDSMRFTGIHIANPSHRLY